MPNFWRVVNEVIKRSDLLLLILDARMIDETRHPEIEHKVALAGKSILYVINKSDLVDSATLEEHTKKLRPCVFMSAKMHQGTTILRKAIMECAKGEKVTVGVLGYPNVGKSSVINTLCGGGAPVAHKSGFTKGLQLLRASSKLYVLDTPGVFPFKERSEVKHLLIGSIDPSRAKSPEDGAAALLEKNRHRFAEWYPEIFTQEADVCEDLDCDGMLSRLAIHWNLKKSGGLPDIRRAAIRLLMDWQRGRIL